MSDIPSNRLDPVRLREEAAVFGALSSPARLAIVLTLADGERSVNELVEMLAGLDCACSVERTNISKHLAVLREAGILSCTGDAQRRIYRLEARCLLDSISCIGSRKRGNGVEKDAGCPACGKAGCA
jgi:DNA-binding transcriptional ArsR family regulator